MDQQARRSAEQQTPPSAEIAQAYLEQADALHARREQRIDRHGLARLELVSAIAWAAFYSLSLLLTWSRGEPSPAAPLAVLALLLVWLQLATEKRESYGVRRAPQRSRRLVARSFDALAVGLFSVGLVLNMADVNYPWALCLIPGVLVLVGPGGTALRDLRASEALPAEQHPPLTLVARAATALLGMLIGSAVWAAPHPDQVIAALAGLAVMLILAAWFFVRHVVDGAPALGELWSWPQWLAFALANAAAVWALLVGAELIPGPANAGLLGGAVACVALVLSASVSRASVQRP